MRPLAFSPGLLHFEVQRGGLLSQAVGVAALPTLEAVVEAKQAHRALAGVFGGAGLREMVVAGCGRGWGLFFT